MADSALSHNGSATAEARSLADPEFDRYMESVNEGAPEVHQNTTQLSEETSNKRKRDEANEQTKPKKEKKPNAPRENTSIYITGIPLDATFDEIHDKFKARCGLIMKNVDDEKPRIKMYADDEGNFKGDALITFFKAASIQLSVLLLDKTDFRNGGSGAMRVQEADMSYKKQKGDAPKEVSEEKSGFKKARSGKDVEKIKRMTKEMNAKLADWSDEEISAVPDNIKPASKWDKCVIAKGLFTLDEIKADPKAIIEVEEDLREQAAEEDWGEITKVVVYDQEEEGVVMLRFSTVDGAEAAVRGMDGRFFDGRQLQAEIPSSRPRYKRSDRNDDADEAARLEAYGQELEEEE